LPGLVVGGILVSVLFVGLLIRTEPARIVWATAAFVALHSFGDGLVLGRDFVGASFPVVRIDALTVSGTVVHRFVEGALLLVPAFAARWSLRTSFALLFVPLVSLPAAFVPGVAFDAMGLAGGSAATLALSTFLAATEASV